MASRKPSPSRNRAAITISVHHTLGCLGRLLWNNPWLWDDNLIELTMYSRSGGKLRAHTVQRLCSTAISLCPNRCSIGVYPAAYGPTARTDRVVEWSKLGNLPVS